MLPMKLPERRPPRPRVEPQDGEPWRCGHCAEVTRHPIIWTQRADGKAVRKIGLCLDCTETLAAALDGSFGCAAGPHDYLMPECPECRNEMDEIDLRISAQQGDFECCECRGVEGVDWCDQEAD